MLMSRHIWSDVQDLDMSEEALSETVALLHCPDGPCVVHQIDSRAGVMTG